MYMAWTSTGTLVGNQSAQPAQPTPASAPAYPMLSQTINESFETQLVECARNTLLDDMNNLFLNRDKYGADFKFKIGQRVFKCHKAVLMARLKQYCSTWSDKVGIITLPKYFQPEALEGFLFYMYTAKVPENFSEISLPMLTVSNYFGYDEVIVRCELDLIQNLTPENSVTVLDVARREKRDHLYFRVAKFIKDNIDSVRKTDTYNAFVDADPQNSRVLLDIITQTLKRPSSSTSMPTSPSPPPYDPISATFDPSVRAHFEASHRFSTSDSECLMPM